MPNVKTKRRYKRDDPPTRRFPFPAPTLRSVRARVTGTTYELVSDKPLGGYAYCTVNDATGELTITSDWGNWAHQWSPDPRSLGAPNLTAFLARRSDVDYCTRKLLGRAASEEFDGDATVRAFCRLVAEMRLRCGRKVIEHARDEECSLEEAESYYDGRQNKDDEIRFLTAEAARDFCNEIEEACDGLDDARSGADLFLERVMRQAYLSDLEFLFDRCWELVETRQTLVDYILRESILPALFAACRQQDVTRMLIDANGPQPPLEPLRAS